MITPSFRRLCTVACTAFTENIDLAFSSREASNNLTWKTQLTYPVNVFQVNSQLRELVKTGRLFEARKVFDTMSLRDEISWTTMITGYVNASDAVEALALFSKMWVLPGVRMDPFILSVAFKACGLDLNVGFGGSLHGYTVKSNFVDSVFVGSALLDMYMKIGKVEHGCKIFEEMPLKNVVSWTAIITGLVRVGRYKESLFYFSDMLKSKVVCDSYCFAIALKACADSGALDYGREIHSQTIKGGVDESSFVANTLVTMYNKCGKFDYGSRLFKNMSIKGVVSWTTCITTYVQNGQEENAVKSFKTMRETGVNPNEFTFAAVISGCATMGRIEWGVQLHAHIVRLGLVDYLSVANSIMTMYAKCGLLTLASMVFEGLTQRDIVSWSTMITGCSRGGYAEEAFRYLSWMRNEGPRPNDFAFSSVLSLCGNMAIPDQGKQLHAHVFCVGLEQTSLIQSSLINMYSKCGNIKEALKVFEEGENNDIVSWTALINGYAEHGYSNQAIDLFQRIPEASLRPDSVTFLGVLTACSHAGLVDLGYHYFNLMSKEYKIHPSKQHYGSMIDLLCRAGQLSEAENMIQSMPCQQDHLSWSALLRACREHGDIDRGRRAAEKILELDPNCAGAHITLANLYAAKGRWREAADTRKGMRLKGVIKEPGWSWIKVKNQLFVFVSGDRSHPEEEDIHDMLDFVGSGSDMANKEIEYFLNYIEG
ncbi:hypothetical protein K2173_021369 [Erythroxylum novogranatense]|uniref:Uncharacterized protein n=1 Tax=Erythroxylum novogranatense TaxID=1862640 RepID=A0AAV8TUM7_9ROSI|nr:hypothetical protein K2173_021369 [Erythroxylum novogranatense]